MKYKLALTVLIIFGLLLLIALIGIGLAVVFLEDIMSGSKGVASLLAFFVAAVIFGIATNRSIERIKRLWE